MCDTHTHVGDHCRLPAMWQRAIAAKRWHGNARDHPGGLVKNMDMIGGCSSYGVVILARAQFSLREDVVAAFKALRGARSAVRMLEVSSQQTLRRTIWPPVAL
jgi:hypothetical protein